MNKKICIITTVHRPFDTRIFHKEAKTLAKAGYKVTLIAQHNKNEVVDGINIIALPKPKNRFSRIISLGWKAYKLALKQEADVYHFHDPEFLPWAKRLKNKTGTKVIYDIHEDYITSIKQKRYMPFFLRKIVSKLINYIESYYSEYLIKILAEKYYQSRFPEGYTILNYPVLSNISKRTKDYSLKLDDNKRVLYTGNVSEDRGAFIHSELGKFIPFLHVYIVGKCPKETANQMYEKAGSSADRLHIDGKGFISFEKISAYYNTGGWLAGLAIFPFTQHYCQKELTKFFEYMNAGIPIIASNFTAWKDLIEGNNCGICVDPLNSIEILDAIKCLMDNPDKAKAMGENGKNAVREKYNWEIEGSNLVNLYKNLEG
jgi:glycosyltransferase involved in cell wall biosynthesis